jgi:hypothetical protein
MERRPIMRILFSSALLALAALAVWYFFID